MKHSLRLAAWELTSRCNMRCRRCRAADAGGPAPDELDTKEALALVDGIASLRNGKAPITLVLSGGEPLVREDFLDIVRAGVLGKLRVAVATNGTLLDDGMARTLRKEGVSRVSLSLDGADAATHERERGLDGAYGQLCAAAARLREAGLPFQVNTTLTAGNADQLPGIVALAPELGAVEHHVVMFVPTGRGMKTADELLGAERYEEVLQWLAGKQSSSPIHIQVTCAPHYQRVLRQMGSVTEGKGGARGGGCLAGTASVFVSSEGEVFPCGYLPIPAGDIRITPFAEIWRSASLFKALRERSRLEGRCGACEYRRVCGGCRARAYAVSGHVFGEEPYCTHEPTKLRARKAP